MLKKVQVTMSMTQFKINTNQLPPGLTKKGADNILHFLEALRVAIDELLEKGYTIKNSTLMSPPADHDVPLNNFDK